MTPTTSRWCAALGLVAALALTSCGSDDDRRAVAALKSQILANNAMTGSSTISDEQADCIADGAVKELGVGRLQDYAILDDDLEVDKKLDAVALKPKDADKLAGVFVDCAEVEQIFEDRLVDQLSRDAPDARARVESCVRDVVTADVVRTILAQRFEQADPSEYTSMTGKLSSCRA